MHGIAMRLDTKLNRLQHELPKGLVVDAAWLSHHGYTSSLRSHYVAAGWLETPARRVYRRPNSHAPLTWENVVVSLQNLLNSPLVVGGRTALEGQGYSHYLSNSVRRSASVRPEPATKLAAGPQARCDLPLSQQSAAVPVVARSKGGLRDRQKARASNANRLHRGARRRRCAPTDPILA